MAKKHKTLGKLEALTAKGKRIIYAPAPPPRNKKKGMSALQAVGGKAPGQQCPRCGEKTALGKLASHRCPELTTKVRVRRLSSLRRKQRYVKVKSSFQQKLSDESKGWY